MRTRFEQALKKHKKQLRDIALVKRKKRGLEQAAETRFERALKRIPRHVSWFTMNDQAFADYMKCAEKIDLQTPLEKSMSYIGRIPISKGDPSGNLVVDEKPVRRIGSIHGPISRHFGKSKPREGIILALLEIRERRSSRMLQREVSVNIQTAVILTVGDTSEVKVYALEHQNPYGHIWIEKHEWQWHSRVSEIIHDLANQQKFMTTLFRFRSPRAKRKTQSKG